MRVTVVASGSKGNSLVIDFGKTRIAVDAGFGPRTLAQKYRAAGVAPESISACIVTHEHRDHAKGALAARKKWKWTIAATAPTLNAIGPVNGVHNTVALDYGSTTTFGDARVTLVQISHDAVAPAAVLVEDSITGARVGIAHDLGVVPDSLASAFAHLDVLVLEANHDVMMLRAGPYPPLLQARIAGSHGHLSNAQCAELARDLVHPGLRAVVLAHLSEKNNTAKIARETVGLQLRRVGYSGKLGAAGQHVSCAVGDIDGEQLRLL